MNEEELLKQADDETDLIKQAFVKEGLNNGKTKEQMLELWNSLEHEN